MKKYLVYALIILLVFTSVNWMSVSAESVSDLDKEIKDLEKQEQDLENKKNELDGQKSENEKKLNENLSEQEKLTNEIASLENKLSDTEAAIKSKENEITSTNQEITKLNDRIEELKVEIENLREEIKNLKKEIKELENKISKREEMLKDRLRNIQKNGGDLKYLEVLLGSTSFSDFISRAAALSVVMKQDEAIMESLAKDKEVIQNKKTQVEENKSVVEENKSEVEGNKKTVEEKKVELEGQKTELVALQGQLDSQKQDKQSLMTKLQREHEILDEIQLDIEEERKIIAAEVEAKQKAIAMAERKKKELEQLNKKPENNSSNPNGIFSSPVVGRESSPFGMRWHPIFHMYRNHDGIDYAVATGTVLRAPADGVVSTARWAGGFGNTIMISHYINGQSYTTLMAHLSSIEVYVGQEVTEGQVIGKTGNTGDSTGPHLHFEVHPGGYDNPVDPKPYLK
ncbi:murein hydrolase activator EnvC family protein [Ornithinibacillus halophilus]|uniref:Murein DD-endopeptidase MepM and murein hydrolase activator NlpD, contain LysM domain n=1 Tax=Ornithinibacillus halophilus TaxID=930117 RepID=A0A1M5FCY0_9BACI|nr:peptidoglycan DD-metalloendopeptidase family protein [Ornithinibacillus halophilus]SHF88921.1 Murein DD-endopeptidase MepM and murein hydrolase activator NlpD, contain LysM domain [Ornithinibacillus halophilus]